MSEELAVDGAAVPAGGTVHWIGTGMSTGSGVRVLIERGPRVEVVLWGRTVEKAQACLDRLGLAGQSEAGAGAGAGAPVRALAYSPEALDAALRPGDVVVSMLPATQHATLLRLCIARRAHFACSSYVSPELLAEVPAALAAGITVLTEAGLDPGIDHVLAHLLVDGALDAVGTGPASAQFTSYCGGIPAVANEFRYRFSWAPLGVLNALLSPARYVEGGAERTVERPWEAVRPHLLAGEPFEVYPNRDSVPFVAQYGFPEAWTVQDFVRGTLRLEGWRAAWAPVFAELREGDPTRIAHLARELAARYPTTDADVDRVVLAVALDVRGRDGREWSGQYTLDLVGDEKESAMARCVSLPLAYGVTRILDGVARTGLIRAAENAEDARQWLEFLGGHGVDCAFSAFAPSAAGTPDPPHPTD